MPGQSRPLNIEIIFSGRQLAHFKVRIWYNLDFGGRSKESLELACDLRDVDVRMPHRITFLHPSGTVSSAILRPPSPKACFKFSKRRSMPVMIGLHGAGLDINDPLVRNSFDPLPDLPAWVLFPSGTTNWSGDDWRMVLINSLAISEANAVQMTGALQMLKLLSISFLNG